MTTPKPFGPHKGPAFTPRYVHSAFQLEALWVRAAKTAKLPGSAFFVLHHLLACHAKGQGAQTRKGIAKESNVCLGSVKNGVKRLMAEGWIIEGPGGLEVKIFSRIQAQAGGQDLTPPIIKEEKRAESSSAPHEAPGGAMPAPTQPGDESKPPKAPDPARPIAEALISAGMNLRGAWSAARRVNPGTCTWQELLEAAQLLVKQRNGVRTPMGLLAHLVTRKGRSAQRVLENARRKARVKPSAPNIPETARNASVKFLGVPGALEALSALEVARVAKEAMSPDAPGFLDAMDAETMARRLVEDMARQAIGPAQVADLERQLESMWESIPSGILRDRARRIHLGRALLYAVGLAISPCR